MATTGQLSLTGSLTDAGIQSRVLDIVANLTSGILASTPVTLGNGDNQITIPSGTTFIIILLPASNTMATGFSWTAADTTHRFIAPGGGWYIVQLTTATPPTSFYLNSNGAQSGVTNIMFL